MTQDKERYFRQLRPLAAYKDMTDEQLNAHIDAKLKEGKPKATKKKSVQDNCLGDPLQIAGLFTDQEEINNAKELAQQYLADYNIETVSDKEMLRQLIYLEVLHKCRLQKQANTSSADNDFTSNRVVAAIHDNLNQIIILKEKLGVTKDSKNGTESDAYKSLATLKQKFKIWRQNNQASRTFSCKHCGQLNILAVRPEAWESAKHPFFKDRIFGNTEVIRLYNAHCAFETFKSKHYEHMFRIEDNNLVCVTCNESIPIPTVDKNSTKDIFGVSTDYIDWLIDKWPKN